MGIADGKILYCHGVAEGNVDYSNVSVLPVVSPQFLGSYLNACNEIDNHNRMRNYHLALETYWVTQSGYF